MAFPKFENAKDPSEKLDFSLNFTDLIGDVEIEDQSVTCSDPALEISNVVLTGKTVSCYAAGGELGKSYPLEFDVTLADGRNFQRTVVLKVADR